MEIIFAIVPIAVFYYYKRKSRCREAECFIAKFEDIEQKLKREASGEYLNRKKAERQLAEAEFSCFRNSFFDFIFLKANLRAKFGKAKRLLESRAFIDEINERFVEKRLVQSKNFFDGLGLTESQRLAVVRDEDANLVNAGAGSGKTRTILGKVSYLLNQKIAEPQEILIVVYNVDAQREIEKRLKKEINFSIPVYTLHALGRKIVEKVQGRSPKVSGLANDAKPFFEKTLKNMFENHHQRDLFSQYFSTYLFEGDPEENVEEKIEYLEKNQYVAGLKSLDGKELKSYEEVQIANWLILSGVKWEYEKKYPCPGNYRPDFYLPDYDLWIEHFGIDEDGNTAPGVSKEKYSAGIDWKRKTHRENNTKLVETYSYEARRQDGLVNALETKLFQYGVEKKPVSGQDIEKFIKQGSTPIPNFIKLIDQFLSLCRENSISGDYLKSRANSNRDIVFLELFEFFRDNYERELGKNGEIDYTDMIVGGTQCLKRGEWRSQFKYILVDEYQDITLARLKMLLELREQVRDARLFCVGDDWQSIYSFQGANVNLITHFDEYVGAMCRTDLNETFRFSQQIADFSRIFITKNPMQLKKEVSSRIDFNKKAKPIRVIQHGRSAIQRKKALQYAIDRISLQSQASKECLVLGRYKHSKPADWNELKKEAELKGLSIEFSTIHQSKGIEKDWVIILGNEFDVNGYGFPSGIQNDPVLNMVLEEDVMFPNAEERRLFYVAITRARKGVFLLALSEDRFSPKRTLLSGMSVFVKEILQSKVEREEKEELEYEPYVSHFKI